MKVTYKTVTKLESQINAQDKRNEYVIKLDELTGNTGMTFNIATAPLDVRAQAAREVLGV